MYFSLLTVMAISAMFLRHTRRKRGLKLCYYRPLAVEMLALTWQAAIFTKSRPNLRNVCHHNQSFTGQQFTPPNQQPWGQQPTNIGWQQQTFNPGQFQPLQPPPKKKRNRLWIILSIIGGILIFSCVLIGVIGSIGPKVTASFAHPEADYKASTINTTVAKLVKMELPIKGKMYISQVQYLIL